MERGLPIDVLGQLTMETLHARIAGGVCVSMGEDVCVC
jgi:hypothetical protein